MARRTKRPPAALGRRIVELVRAGRSPEKLKKESEPWSNMARNWAVQSDFDEGLSADGSTTAERNGLPKLRRKVKQLDHFAARTGRIRRENPK